MSSADGVEHPSDRSSEDAGAQDSSRLIKRDGLIIILVIAAIVLLIGLLAVGARGDTNGTVTGKDVTHSSKCNRYGRNCRLRTCLQVTYVTDDERTKRVCVSQARFDELKVGDHFSE